MSVGVEYLVVALIGVTVGLVEVVSRYTDSIALVMKLPATWLYAGVNAGAAALVLAMARSNDWTFGIPGDHDVARVVGSGVAAMAVLRTGIGVFKIGDKEVAAGPGAFLTAMLGIFERVVNRKQGHLRSQKSSECMEGVSFARAKFILPEHCLLLLKDPTKEESQELAAAVARIATDQESSDQAKAYNLGVALINFAGPEVTSQAVQTLRHEIDVPAAGATIELAMPAPAPKPVRRAPRRAPAKPVRAARPRR
jgi:hypothetical protein